MPGMIGFALRSLMLRRPELASVGVIVLSAYWHRPSETLDVAAVLSKPLNIDRLLETVRRVTARQADGDGEMPRVYSRRRHGASIARAATTEVHE